ncbi:methyltransferase type 11 [Mycena pura]|uniref:Methyltransferase type 11 n=1 Tax=Mycena pura TaxID=153505 RepID=A0AAD6Y7V2_9AGAR|nr:methyltransferase type 11 [Mycena pura]
MGSVPSTQQRVPARKRSTVLTRIALSCTSGTSLAHDAASDLSNDTCSIFNEKSPDKEREREHDELPPKEIHQPLAATYANAQDRITDAANAAYQEFLSAFPEYRLTWILDTLRRHDYSRLETTGETYVDYMGGAIYPASLVRVHAEFLSRSVLGNTHSVSNSSKLSLKCADEARSAVLSFFRASSDDYAVIFTANATGALKLVGEAFPFTGGSSYVLSCDSHNSIHGIREYAMPRGARVCYIPPTKTGGFDPSTAKNILLRNRPRARDTAPSLFALTGQSNITNSKTPLSIIEYASSLGYHTLLDAAALAATSTVSLSDCPVDAMAVSFYKMFGFPTGVGALVVKKAFLTKLKRPWFAGGTVDVVQVPGTIVTRTSVLHEQFEDGTINYLNLPAVTHGVRFLSAYLPFLPLRLSCLMRCLVSGLTKLRHENGAPTVRILSATPMRRLTSVGEQSDTGSLISLLFLSPAGEMLPLAFVEDAAAQASVSLRTGCMCNPGGAAVLLGLEADMQRLHEGVTLADFSRAVGHELGVVRISLGLASNFQDVWNVLRFAGLLANERTRGMLWDAWVDADADAGRALIGQAI